VSEGGLINNKSHPQNSPQIERIFHGAGSLNLSFRGETFPVGFTYNLVSNFLNQLTTVSAMIASKKGNFKISLNGTDRYEGKIEIFSSIDTLSGPPTHTVPITLPGPLTIGPAHNSQIDIIAPSRSFRAAKSQTMRALSPTTLQSPYKFEQGSCNPVDSINIDALLEKLSLKDISTLQLSPKANL
jgi:hypothetical protein